MFGRNGESPVAVLAPRSPSDCFDIAVEAARIALAYRTPVMVLSDGATPTVRAPGRIPRRRDLSRAHRDPLRPRREVISRQAPATRRPWPGSWPCPERRDWSIASAVWRRRTAPATSRTVSGQTRPDGPAAAGQDRRHRGARPAGRRPDRRRRTAHPRLGRSFGPIEACCRVRRRGIEVAQAQLRHLNPLPANLGDILRRYPTVVLPEMNLGQLALLLRGGVPGGRSRSPRSPGWRFADEIEAVIDAAAPTARCTTSEADKMKFARLTAAAPIGRTDVEAGPAHDISDRGRPEVTPSKLGHRSSPGWCRPAGLAAEVQGLHQRPGGPLVPGLR